MRKIIFIAMALILLIPSVALANSTEVSIPDTSARLGEEVSIPITVDVYSVPGSHITIGAYHIILYYDSGIIEAISVSPDNDLAYSISNDVDDSVGQNGGIVRIAGWCVPTVDLLTLDVIFNVVGEGKSILQIEVLDLVDSQREPVEYSVSNGTFSTIKELKGDVTLDGKVTIGDAMYIAQYLIGIRDINDIQLDCADVSKDGVISIVDAMYIAQSLV